MTAEGSESGRPLPTITRRSALAATASGVFGTAVSTPPATAQQDDRLQWVFETDADIWPSPTVVDGTVFVGNNDGNLYAVGTGTGEQQWIFETNGDVSSSPTVVDGTVFVGSDDDNLYAVAAETGEQRWIFETNGNVPSSPTVADGTVFVGSDDNNLYAVAAETGEQQWAFETGGDVWSSPTVVDGTVFVGSDDNNLYAVDAKAGEQQWAFETGSNVWSSPTVVDGTVFVGSDDNNLYAVDTETGEQQWIFETGLWIRSSPTIVNGTVFIGSSDNNLYAVDAETGEQQWIFETGSDVWSSPTVVDRTVFVGCHDANLYAVDAETGEQQWAFETGDYIPSSPTVVDGTVFVGGGDSNLYAVDADVSGSSKGSRINFGTLGHHGDWYYAEQSIEIPTTGPDTTEPELTDTDTTEPESTDTDTIAPGSSLMNAVLLAGGIGSLAGGGYLIRRRRKSTEQSHEETAETISENSAADTTGTDEQPPTGIDDTTADNESTIDGYRSGAEAALETAVTAKSNNNLSKAADAYTEAITEYQAALDGLDPGATEQRTEIEAAIESTRADLETIKTHHEQRSEVIDALKSAESSLQEAVVAYLKDNQTVGRIRFRQARDTFEDAHEIIAESEEELFTKPVEVGVTPNRELASTTLSELASIPETAATELADAGIETVDDLNASSEWPWTPAIVEELVADENISEDVATTLTVLSWWPGDEGYTFETAEAVKRRQQQADYGFNQTV